MSLYDEVLIYLMQKNNQVKKIQQIITIDPPPTQQTANLSQQKEISETVMFKPLRSTKNQFQMRDMFFRSHKHREGVIRKHSFSTSQLQKQKEELIESIHILRIGAISAITEKEDKLQRLKEATSSQNNQEIQLYQQMLKQSQCSQRQLKVSLKQLHYQLHQERKSLTDILQQKQATIQGLQSLISNFKNYAEQLQINEQKLLHEIKNMQNKIYYLSKQLQEYTVAASIEEYTQKNKSNEKNHERPSSVSSNIPYCNSTSNLLDALHINDLSTSIERQYTQKINELIQKHLQQIVEIKEFYKKEISHIRNIYNAYIADELLNKSIEYKIQESEIKLFESDAFLEKYLNRCQSSSDTNLCREMQDKKEAMEMISQPSIHILKEQINFVHDYSTPLNYQNIGQASSQFTKEHFQDPIRYIKQRSVQSFKSRENDKVADNEHCQIKTYQKEVTQPKETQFEDKKKQVDWQKTLLFATGLISGISLTSVVNMALKKKNVKNILNLLKI